MKEKIMQAIETIMQSMLVLIIIGFGCLIFVVSYYIWDVEVEREIEISILMDSPVTNIYGNPFYINSDPSMGFFFYVEESDGSYKAHSISAYNTNIHLVEGEHKIIIHATVPRFLENISATELIDSKKPRSHYDIYVPPGTIKEGYRLDAE